MLDFVFAHATRKAALAALAVLLVSTYVIRNHSPKDDISRALKGDYVSTDNPPDTEHTLWYDSARVTGMLKRYNEPAHYPALYEAHERFILRHDLVYPLCYAIPCVFLLAYLYPRRGGPRWLVLVPPAVMLFDYAENFTMLAFIRAFRANPQTPLKLLELSRAFTLTKLLLLMASFGLLALFLIMTVAARFRARPSET